jgi:hypothetical protein
MHTNYPLPSYIYFTFNVEMIIVSIYLWACMNDSASFMYKLNKLELRVSRYWERKLTMSQTEHSPLNLDDKKKTADYI